MEVDIDRISLYRGWLNYDTFFLHSLVESEGALRESRALNMVEMTSPLKVMEWFEENVKGRYIVPDESCWIDAHGKVDWTSIHRDWVERFGDPSLRGHRMHSVARRSTRENFVRKYSLGASEVSGKDIAVKVECHSPNPLNSVWVTFVGHRRTMYYSAHFRLFYGHMRTPSARMARLLCETALKSLQGDAEQVRLEGVMGRSSGTAIGVRWRDPERGSWSARRAYSNVGVLYHEHTGRCSVYADLAADRMAKKFRSDCSAICDAIAKEWECE